MPTLTKAELKLYVWKGDINSRPTTPNYTLTKSKLSTEDVIVFEISELIKDYIVIDFDGNYNTIKQTRWVEYSITSTYDDDSTQTHTETALAFRGYGNLKDGINPELSKDLMISNRVIHNKCGEELTIPFYAFEDGVTKVKYVDGQTELDTLVLGTAGLYTIAQDVSIAMPANDYVTIDRTATQQTDSDTTSDSQTVPADATSITFTNSKGEEKTLTIECIDECHYKGDAHKISFVNKYGVMQDIWFFGKRTDSVTSERESYKRSIHTVTSTGVEYDQTKHQNQYLANQGGQRFTMETGFIHESYNEVMKELLVSEFVYIHDKDQRSPSNAAFDMAVPIQVVTNSLQLKTRRFDKLINYKLDFEMDSELVQSIR